VHNVPKKAFSVKIFSRTESDEEEVNRISDKTAIYYICKWDLHTFYNVAVATSRLLWFEKFYSYD
jgi:hypothetical protein